MASERSNDAGEVSQAPSDAASQNKAKLKRRRVKREGPPQLQFLIATDPSQFRNEHAKRSVRSQAMIHWRHEENQKKRKGSLSDNSTSASSPRSRVYAATASPKNATVLTTGAQTALVTSSASRSRGPSHGQPQHAPWQAGPSTNNGSSSWQLSARGTVEYCPHYLHNTRAETVTDYEESEMHEQRQFNTFVMGLAIFYGSAHDPFDVFPQFKSKELNSMYLSRSCMRVFASDATMHKWLPLTLSHPQILLSSTVIASAWLDMQSSISGDSTMTVRVKAETIGMINERLASPTTLLDDETLIIILHLFAGEMWICNEKALRIHETGVATFFSRRGGLSEFTNNRTLAEVAMSCCYHCDIFCEAEILPVFRNGLPAEPTSNCETALPESPLYCPRRMFLTIPDDPKCSPSTLELLNDMRDLTKVFVAYKTALNTIHDIDAMDVAHIHPHTEGYEATIYAIQTRLAELPSAHTPGVSVSGDWVYESCRIAALIYTTAIATDVPFYVAANPKYAKSLFSSDIGNSDEHLPQRHLTEALYEALRRTNTSNVWKNMSGVLYWVSAVGAAAARLSSEMDMTQRERLRPEAYSVWVRRWLIITATRTMIVLVFEHPTAIIAAQHMLLKVQELVGSHTSRQLRT